MKWKVISGVSQAGATMIYFNANGNLAVTHCLLNKYKDGLPLIVIEDGIPVYVGTLHHPLPTKVNLQLIAGKYYSVAKREVGTLSSRGDGEIVFNHERLRRFRGEGSEKKLLSDFQHLIPKSILKSQIQ